MLSIRNAKSNWLIATRRLQFIQHQNSKRYCEFYRAGMMMMVYFHQHYIHKSGNIYQLERQCICRMNVVEFSGAASGGWYNTECRHIMYVWWATKQTQWWFSFIVMVSNPCAWYHRTTVCWVQRERVTEWEFLLCKKSTLILYESKIVRK